MAAGKRERRQVLVPDDIWEDVEILAALDTTSSSQIVRKACIDYTDSRREAIDRFKKANG